MKTGNQKIIARLREHIPSFECVPGCHDCCGPVTTSPEEMSRLPVKSDAEHEAALEDFNCVHLGPEGCRVYEERPLICRLFGTTQNMPCPNGRRPERMTDADIERQVHGYIANTRQVLV
ncbi:YkgJ family cysteine cluster protein [Marinobacter sp. 2_MG-2023]|uniref:YkgJ family cysteine cluster protein n=1 Tax=Marinobacter sp. 2_MG-2023 TaxID=3062679 RepID=UPI0026E2A6A9|nr:YkgJ family cysteine cluster protein [Marinobacter sp. 2_MG-2023]MDO6441689.1 YkgJ family cysteine cluster protein [Marinobacter sp. 2_MG-2023]